MVKTLLELIAKLAETYLLTFLLLFVIGALLLATGATGGWPEFGITVSEPLWRYIIGVCGFILLFAAIVFVFLERRIRPALISRERAGVSIDYPADGIHVRVPCPVSGKFKHIPKGAQLWMFTIGGQGRGLRYYPYPASAGCATCTGGRRIRLAPPGMAAALS